MKISTLFFITILMASGCAKKEATSAPSQIPTTQKPSATIHEAALKGDLESVKNFIIAGLSVESKDGDEDGRTALHCAAESGDAELIRWLLNNNATVDATNKYLMTPLHYAAIHEKANAAKILIEAGATIDAENHGGWTPLFNAVMENSSETAQLLIEAGANINHVDSGGNTPLHYAAGNGHKESCMILLDAGASINVTNKNGQTPLTRLKERARWSPSKHKACANYLIKNGAK